MAPLRTVHVVVVSLFAVAMAGCPDHHGEAIEHHGDNTAATPAPNRTFPKCTACLSDDPKHCATYTPECGDSDDEVRSQYAAKNALCDTLSAAELARRPTPAGFEANEWYKNACYRWPEEAFKISCTPYKTHCESVPIH